MQTAASRLFSLVFPLSHHLFSAHLKTEFSIDVLFLKFSFLCVCVYNILTLSLFLFLSLYSRTLSHSDRWGSAEEEGPDSTQEGWGSAARSGEGGAAAPAQWRTESGHRHAGGGAPQNIRWLLLWLLPLQGLCLNTVLLFIRSTLCSQIYFKWLISCDFNQNRNTADINYAALGWLFITSTEIFIFTHIHSDVRNHQ